MPEEKNDAESLFLKKLQEEENALLENSNKSVETAPASSPKKQKKNKKKSPKKKKKVPGVALFATAFLMFITVVSLLIFTMSVGGAGNPVLRFFGQNEDTVKDFLVQVVNGSFGFLSVILLLVIATTFFFGLSRSKQEVQKRGIAFAFTLVSVGLQFVTILAWLGMYNFVSALEVETGQKQGSIVIILPDGTELKQPISDDETENLIVPMDVTFSSRELEKDALQKGREVLGVEWDFDDNGDFERLVKESEVIRRIDRVGQWNVRARLLLKNGDGWESSLSFFVPQGTFRATPETGPIPLTVLFSASDIVDTRGAPVVAYEWDFNNDFIYEESTPNPTITYEFDKIGTYPVRLKVVKRDKTVQQYEKEIVTLAALPSPIKGEIQSIPPLTNPSQKKTEVTKGDTILFQASDFFSTEGGVDRYTWSFSDSAFSESGSTASHIFRNIGEIDVSLVIRDTQENIREEHITVVVNEPAPEPEASFVMTPEATKEDNFTFPLPTEVSFDASASKPKDGEEMIAYEWDFDGDGIIDAEGMKLKHTYTETGDFTVTLTAKNASKKSAIVSRDIRIRAPDLTAIISADPENTRVPCEVSFDGSLSSCSNCEILGYKWDFGDGQASPLAGAHVTHMYNKVGKFPVTLTVYTKTESASTTQNIFCRETPVRSCFTSNKLIGKAPLITVFNPECSTGTIVDWKWNFGDNSASSDQVPTHIFRKQGIYEVVLTVTDSNGNIDKKTMEVIVE